MLKSAHAIDRSTATTATARALKDKILRGELAEGAQLRQVALAEEFGVSRIPIREALRQLEAEGLVTFSPYRGAIVSVLSVDEIRELFEIRALMEPDILRHAIPKLTEEHLGQAEEVLEAYEAAFRQQQDIAAWGELNWKFHSTLYAPAERPASLNILRALHTNTDRYLRMQLVLARGSSRAQQEHRVLLELSRDGDTAGGVKFLRRHILTACRSLTQFLLTQRARSGHDVASV